MRSVRIFFALITLLLIIVLFIIVSLQLLIDPNKLKPIIASELKSQTGYQLNIDGDLKWAFYPLFTIHVKSATLTKPDQNIPFLQLSDIDMGTPLGKIFFKSFPRREFSGFLDIAHAKFLNMKASDVSLKFLLGRHRFILEPIYANFYGGTLHATFSTDNLFLPQLPNWQGKLELDEVQLLPLFSDLKTNSNINIGGIAKVTFLGGSQGKTDMELRQHLQGNLSFDISQGKLIGIDLNYLILSAEALIKREAIPPTPSTLTTPFDHIQGTAVIQQGVATFNNTLLSSTLFKANINGQIDLTKQTLNLKCQLMPIDTVKNPWMVPVLVTGSLQHPNISLDMDEINKMAVRIGIDKAKEELKKTATDFIQNLLTK